MSYKVKIGSVSLGPYRIGAGTCVRVISTSWQDDDGIAVLLHFSIPWYGVPCVGGNGCRTGNICIFADNPCAGGMGSKDTSCSDSNSLTSSDPGYGRGVPFLGLLFQWLGVTLASNPFVPMQSYVFFMFYIDEINPQCKGDLSCGKPSS